MNEKSSTDKLRQAAQGKQVANRDNVREFRMVLDKNKSAIAAALPRHITPERMVRIIQTAFNTTDHLNECDPVNVLACCVLASQLGLEIGVQGQAYLVPYWDSRKSRYVCQFIPGWRGLQDLVNRSGRASTWTGAVYDGDDFEYEFGTSPHILHRPSELTYEPDKLTHAYAVGRVKGGEWPVIEVWPTLKLTRHRNRFNKVGDKHYSFKHWEQYSRKVALMQVFKYVPMSIEIQIAAHMDRAAEAGAQQLNLDEVLNGDLLNTTLIPDQSGDEPTDEKETGSQQGLLPMTEDEALARIKGAADADSLDQLWFKQIVPAFEKLPINVEAAKHDRSEFLKGVEAKKRGEG